MRKLLPFLLCLAVLPLSGQAPVPSSTDMLAVSGGNFTLHGRPFQIIAGEMHYARVPRAEWRSRFRMARAMGLNTITTYAFWNLHEPTQGHFDFAGQNDLAEYIREAQQEGLYVILRPGPYVCAEWEWGGYPAWLLKDHNIVVRSSDPRFMRPANTWLMRLGRELAPLQSGNGGPILAVQVENEYGSFGDDHAYMEQVKRTLLEAGFNKALLYTADGPTQLPKGSLPELPAVINFGGGEAEAGFRQLHEMRPEGPFMSGEYWAGWFDHWGEKHHTTDGDKEAAELKWMLEHKYSVNIYMFHGGTSFGWMNGANSSSSAPYEPDTNSYDYDAPLSEAGLPSAKYSKFRNAITEATGTTPPSVPTSPVLAAVPKFNLPESASLWSSLPTSTASPNLQTMEDLGQAFGYILYRTVAPAQASGDLVVEGLHDYAVVYVNGKKAGTLDRRLQQSHLSVSIHAGDTLDLLVENSGRVNFTTAIRGERKGILGSVVLNGTPLHNWQITPLPFDNLVGIPFTSGTCTEAPCLYRGSFQVTDPHGTFLDTSAFHKGFVWINGKPLGRVWQIGPQHRLFVPGSWLTPASNSVVVLDLEKSDAPSLTGLTQSTN